MKFAISFIPYSVVLAWMISVLPGRRRLAWWAGTVVVVASVGEVVLIAGQAARGRPSHYNVTTPLDAAVFSAMGALVATLYVLTLGLGVLLLRRPLADRSLTWAMRLAVPVAIAGLSVGYLMVSQAPVAESAADASGAVVTLAGAHAVGVADGGPGLPFVGWSTTGGDLRVGHFVGMHALQVLPLLALLVTSGWGRRRLDETARVRVVVVSGLAYAAALGLLVWQALRGQSLVSPDALTSAVGAGIAAAAGTALALVIRGSASRRALLAPNEQDRATTDPVRGGRS
ncbi:MAG: hypothetical protein ACRCXL_13100 [Dermatophilaceae bacterium]